MLIYSSLSKPSWLLFSVRERKWRIGLRRWENCPTRARPFQIIGITQCTLLWTLHPYQNSPIGVNAPSTQHKDNLYSGFMSHPFLFVILTRILSPNFAQIICPIKPNTYSYITQSRHTRGEMIVIFEDWCECCEEEVEVRGGRSKRR